jgi:DNA-directed RNA polymerase specialized sigma24 family protein
VKNHSMPLPCNDWVERLAIAHLSALSPTEVEALYAHIASCGACAAVKREYDEIDRLIGNVTCTKALPGLPPMLLRQWMEQDRQVALRISTSIGMSMLASGQRTSEISCPSLTPFSSNVALTTLSLSVLVDRCMREIEKYRHNEPYNDQYCLEIFHRAMVKHDPDAWELLQKHFSPTVRAWMRNHPQRDAACRYQPEEDYVAETFVRVWQASMRNTLEFVSMAAALRYLKLSLQAAVIDTLRAYSRPREVPLPDPGSDTHYTEEPAMEDEYESNDLWDIIKSLLPNERERQLAYLLFVCGLKSREIVSYVPEQFSDIQEIYRLKRNITERLMRQRGQFRWRLSPPNE